MSSLVRQIPTASLLLKWSYMTASCPRDCFTQRWVWSSIWSDFRSFSRSALFSCCPTYSNLIWQPQFMIPSLLGSFNPQHVRRRLCVYKREECLFKGVLTVVVFVTRTLPSMQHCAECSTLLPHCTYSQHRRVPGSTFPTSLLVKQPVGIVRISAA
jgi:hypothetical protein